MSRGERLALLAIGALALWLRWWPDGSAIAGRAFLRHDEQHYVDLARELLNGRFDTRYFINPTLFGYVLAGASALVGGVRVLLGDDPSYAHFVARETMSPWLIVLTGRLLSIAACVATVLLLARLGRRLFSPAVGLAAALLLALDGLSIGRAPLCGNESLTTLLALLAVEGVAGRDAATLSRGRRIRAGLLLGLATATKYSAGIFGLVLLVALRRRVVPALLGAALGYAIGAPATLLSFEEFRAGFATQAAFLHDGYRPEDAQAAASGWLVYARDFATAHGGVVLAVVVALGIVASLAAALRRDGAPHRLLLSASLPLYLFLGSGIFHRDRFLLPATPYLLLHGAWLLVAIGEALARTRSQAATGAPRNVTARLARLAPFAPLVLIAAAGAPSVVAQRPLLAALHGKPDAASELFAEVHAALRPDDRLFEFTLQLSDELLIDAQPWRELRLAEPPALLRAAVERDLAQRGLLPGGEPLRRWFTTARSLAELQAELARNGATALLVVLPSRHLGEQDGLQRANRDPPFRDCPWWSDFATWLGTLPRRLATVSRDGALIAAVVELPR